MAKDSFTASLLKGFAAKANQKRMMNNLNRQNQTNRGIIRYRPSQIEAFIDPQDPIENMIVSGGENELRLRAVIRQAICAFNQGISVLVIHENNTLLESKMNAEFGHTGNYSIINRHNPYYEPFLGLSNPEISRMVLQCSEKGLEIRSQGRYYIDAMSEFIKTKGIKPYCDMFINCPHHQIFDRVTDAEMNGKLNSQKASQIKSMLMQGQVEQSNIEEFFYRLQHQAGSMIAKKQHLSNAVSVKSCAQKGSAMVINILSSTNTLFMNLLLQDIENALTDGNKLLVIFDGVSLVSSEQLLAFAKANSTNCKKVFCSDDVFVMAGGEENTFTGLVGTAARSIVYSHRSGLSCAKWADVFGQFDMQDITQTMSNARTKKSIFDFAPDTSTTSTLSVTNKREYIVKPEEINRMRSDEVYVYDGFKKQLSYTTVI